jgi:hypothetical protein
LVPAEHNEDGAVLGRPPTEDRVISLVQVLLVETVVVVQAIMQGEAADLIQVMAAAMAAQVIIIVVQLSKVVAQVVQVVIPEPAAQEV